jgi:serine/threonine-protein kinase
MRAVDADNDVAREIEDAVRRSLGEAGMNGRVQLTGRTLTLHASGAPVEIDALYLVEQWPLLPADLRQRKADDVAARLIDAHKATGSGTLASAGLGASQRPLGTSGPPGTSGAPHAPLGSSVRPSGAPPRYVPSARPTGAPAPGPGKPMVVPIGVLFVGLCAAALAYLLWRGQSPSTGSAAPEKPTASAPPESADERINRLCTAARTQVLTSGTLARIDAEVWLAELWLATSKPNADLAHAKGIADLIQQGKLTASADPDLAALREAQVEVGGEESGPHTGVDWHALQIRFRGGYVSQFFDAGGRERMNRVANKLADVTGAEMGALYGRCGHLRYHDIGAWYRGASPAQAAASLVYTMGLFSERRLTNHDPNAPPTTADLGPLVKALGKLEKGAFEAAVRDAGGTYAPGATAADPTVIAFALGGPTRAARASGSLAVSAGMGPDAPRPATTP